MTSDSGSEVFLDRDARLALLDTVCCGVWVYDGEDVRYVNRALSDITGFSREELLEPGFFAKLIHPDDRDSLLARGQARVRGETVPDQYEIRIIGRSGELRDLRIDARRVVFDVGPASVVSATDVTPLKDAQRAIREGTVQVRSLLHALPAHVIGTDATGKPTFVNNHWLEFTGQSRGEAMRTGTSSLMHDDDRKRAGRAWSAAKKAGEGYDIDYRVRDRHGDFRWQNFRIRPVKDRDEQVLGWVSVSVDIQDAKALQEQLELANDQLADAVHAKDEVLGLISHELRTPLTTLLGNARFLRTRADELTSEDRVRVATDLENDARRLYAIIENMLVLSRASVGEPAELEPARLVRLAESTLRDFQIRVPGREVSLISTGPPCFALANPTYYQQILGNLLSNADKYSPGGLPIDVTVSCGESVAATTVSDRGAGIPVDEIEKIFDPFFRSPKQSKRVSGAGLGLTVCQRLVELMDGTISVAPRDGGGCEFTFTLPAAEFDEE
ncbi:MAG: PAS domain-containing sensor histidine kinase [Tepidiformaceae bacterium]